ncbi:hypothetical protein L1887_14515 [Cichorium endivia]|nr:hypothetical protein L1887_14515 [Cichorium endivia]
MNNRFLKKLISSLDLRFPLPSSFENSIQRLLSLLQQWQPLCRTSKISKMREIFGWGKIWSKSKVISQRIPIWFPLIELRCLLMPDFANKALEMSCTLQRCYSCIIFGKTPGCILG